MKTNKLYTIILTAAVALSLKGKAQQTTEELINLLIQKQVISQTDADSLRAENALKAQADKEKQNKFQLYTGKPVTLSGYTQVRFISQQEAFKPDYLDIRRARLDFKAQINEHFDSRLQVEFAGTPKILDAILNYKYRDWLKFSAGQFYIPFSAENTTSDNKLELIDRSQVVNALAGRDKDVIGNQNGRDLGIQASGSIVRINDRFLADYYIGGFNGAGINTADNNESKDFSGRLVLHPLKNLDLGGSYYNGYDIWGTPAKEHVRKRNGAELSYTYLFATIKGEFIQGLDAGVEKNGWYAQLSAFIYKKNIQLVAKYDTYDPNIDPEKKDDSSTNYVFGVNLNFNNWSKLQINYINRAEEGKQINNDVITVQIQLSF
jgi:phosphate-selective porin